MILLSKKDDFMNLIPFCGKISASLKEPFSDRGYTYATDSFIIIRVPVQIEITKEVPSGLVCGFPTFDHDQITSWLDMPVLPTNKIACEKCGGTGKEKTCYECNGNGVLTFDGDYNAYEVVCKSCDGGGKLEEVPCETCEGNGKVPEVPYVVLDGVCLGIKYLELLKDLPDIKFAIISKDRSEPVRFKFAGGEGLLMQYLTY